MKNIRTSNSVMIRNTRNACNSLKGKIMPERFNSVSQPFNQSIVDPNFNSITTLKNICDQASNI